MRNELYDYMEELSKALFSEYSTIPCDVVKTTDGYEVDAVVAGVNKEDIEISFEGEVLTITVNPKKEEKKEYLMKQINNSKMKRELSFKGLNVDTINAKLENGILVLSLNVKEKENTKKNIEIM